MAVYIRNRHSPALQNHHDYEIVLVRAAAKINIPSQDPKFEIIVMLIFLPPGVGHKRSNQPGAEQEVGRGPGEGGGGQGDRAHHFPVARKLDRQPAEGERRVRRSIRGGRRTPALGWPVAGRTNAPKQQPGHRERAASAESQPDKNSLLFSSSLYLMDRPLIRPGVEPRARQDQAQTRPQESPSFLHFQFFTIFYHFRLNFGNRTKARKMHWNKKATPERTEKKLPPYLTRNFGQKKILIGEFKVSDQGKTKKKFLKTCVWWRSRNRTSRSRLENQKCLFRSHTSTFGCVVIFSTKDGK